MEKINHSSAKIYFSCTEIFLELELQVCHLQTLTQLGGQTFAHLLAYKFDKAMNSDWPLDIVYREKSFFYDGESRHLWCYIYFTRNLSVSIIIYIMILSILSVT